MPVAEDRFPNISHRIISQDWGGLAVIYREAAYTPLDITMPRTGVGIAFKGDTRSRSRRRHGETQVRPLQAGSTFVFADDDFIWAENDNPYAGLALGFDELVLTAMSERLGAAKPDLRSCHFEQDATLLAIGKLMAAELLTSGVGSELYRDSLATLAKVHLLRRYAGVAPEPQRPGAALSQAECAQVHDYMMAHLSQDLTLERIGRIVNLSPYHFARLFKKATGMAPHKYLTMLRMRQARELLTGTRLPVSTIAWRVGFASASQFGTQFKRATGVAPAAFRNVRPSQESDAIEQEVERHAKHGQAGQT